MSSTSNENTNNTSIGANATKNPKLLREGSLIEPFIKNPFVLKVNFTLVDRIKICINAVLLLPIRVLLITILTIISIIIATIVTWGLSEQYLKENPLTGWRKRSRQILRFFGRAIAFCFGFYKIKKNGRRVTRSEATIFVAAPHSSFMDAFVFFVLGLPSGVSRVENARIPFMGPLLRAIQPILVSREDSKNKFQVIEEIKRRAAPDSDWPQLLVFPEGTTTNRSCLITFKPGAFIPGLPVQPVVVQYHNKLDTITWTWEGFSAMQCAFYTLCQFSNYMEITYLPVYTPNDNEKLDAKLFAKNVRNEIANYLNVITTFHTFEDCRLMLKARELQLPFESGLIEFEKLKEKLNINYENCATILKKFTLHARKSDGKMSLNDFCSYLDLPASNAIQQVFKMYDRDRDGFIDFREFLIGLSLLSQPANTEDTLRLAFSVIESFKLFGTSILSNQSLIYYVLSRHKCQKTGKKENVPVQTFVRAHLLMQVLIDLMFDKEEKGFISLVDLQSILFSAFSMSNDEVKTLFQKVDTKNDGRITFDELKAYAEQKPEYAKIFLVFNELKIMQNIVDYENIAESATAVAAATVAVTNEPISSSTSNTILKRPTSDKSKQPNESSSSKIGDTSTDPQSTTSRHTLTKVE